MTKYLKGVTLTYTSAIFVLILSFLINVIIVRTLGASGKGVIALLQNYFLILVVIFMFGMSESNIYYLSNRRYEHRDVFSNIIYHTIITSIIIISLSILLKGLLIKHFLKNIDEGYYLTALWLFPSFFLFLHVTTMLLGHKNIMEFNIVTVSRHLFILLFLIILIRKFGIQGALIAVAMGFIVAIIIGARFLLRYGTPSASLNYAFLKSAFIFGAKSQAGLILARIDRRLDIFVINLFLNPAQVGYYAIAVAVAELAWHISNAIATVLFPEVSGMKKEDAYEFTSFICRNAFFVVSIFSVTLFFLGGILIMVIFGPTFIASLTPLRLLLPGILALSINKVLCAGFSGTGRPEYGTYTATLSAIATVTLDFLLIPALGIKGAAIASSIAYTIATITGVTLFRKMSGLPLARFLLVTREDISKYPELLARFVRRIKNA